MGQVLRRQFLMAASALLASPLARAQQARKIQRVGLLANLPRPPNAAAVRFLDAIRLGLQEAGYVEGRNLVIDARWETKIDALSQGAADLVNSGVDVLLTFTTPATRAAAKATHAIPIVFSMVSDPIGSGFVTSLARPGRNITGVTNAFPKFSGKLLELVREVVPGTRRVTVLWNPDNTGKALDFKALEVAARELNVMLQSVHVRAPKDFAAAFAKVAQDRPDALITLADTVTYRQRNEIAAFAISHRIPTAFNHLRHTEAGGLMSFSPDNSEILRRAGVLVGKVLGGARPADLPVEQPTKFELVINLKTAKALGITIPQSIMLRADQVIE